jgi:hypothetical protein
MTATHSSVQQSLTCFLSSALSDSSIAQDVRKVLDSVGVDVRTSDEIPLGADVASSIVDTVLSVDFVCIVLAADLNNPAVWYEAGIAAGSQRPVLVIAEGKAIDQMPFNLFAAPIIRYHHDTPDIFRESLIAYTRQVQPLAAQLKVDWNQVTINISAEAEVKNSDAPVPPTEKATQELLLEHFMHEGILVGGYTRISPSKRADALISFPMLGDEFNTIIIEIKHTRSTEKRDIAQVADYMKTAGARLGMIVYLEHAGQKPETRIFGSAGIMLISASELLHWDYQRIIGELARLRNQLIHSN